MSEEMLSATPTPLDKIECNARNNCGACETVKTTETETLNTSATCPTRSLFVAGVSHPKTIESESQTDIAMNDNQINTTNDNFIKAIQSNNDSTDHDNNDNKNIKPNATEMKDDEKKIDINYEVNSKYFDEPEISLIEIHDKLEDKTDHFSSVSLSVDSESEEDDQLKPLMIDNHTISDQQQKQKQQEYYQSPTVNQLMLINSTMKQNDSKDSFSSTDSELSSNYEHKNCFNDHHCIEKTKESECCNLQHKTMTTPTTIGTITSTPIVEIREIDTLNPNEIPDDNLSSEIVEQVEYYFSNDSILKDAFLLKHVRRNKEGFVSLKLVSSFKRVRQLTKDWRIVGHAIKKSKKIELNDLGTKIRRLESLPSFDETMPSRTIVVCDLPCDKLCIESVSDIFSKCGEIALIRILRPGNAIPVDVRQFMNKYPEMQQKECALVEFVESNSARIAQSLDDNFKVYEMVAPKKKTGKKAPHTVTKLIENYKYHENNYERSRGGSLGGVGIVSPNPLIDSEFKYKLRRNNSEYYVKPDQQQHQQMHMCSQRKFSFNNNNNNNTIYDNNHFGHYPPRRVSNCLINNAGIVGEMRKYSSCSEGYSSCSELSRRTSCSSGGEQSSRRTSSCSEYCPCSRRSSQCSEMFRRMSYCSEHNNNIRKYSNGSINNNNNNNNYDRNYSSPSCDLNGRRVSMDSNYERKNSTGSIERNQMIYDHRKYSNGFDPNRKLSNTEQYFNGRRISTDSGYDRKLSFGSSDYGTSPRSRSNSFLTCQHKNVENVVRTPIGPDGSKGFTSRTRKLGQIIPPI